MNFVKCCYKCTKRQVGCHSTCSVYKQQRKAQDKFNEDKQSSYQKERILYIKVGRNKK